MVKESERKKAYQPRGPHKADCLCVVCKRKRGIGESIAPPEPEPASLLPHLKVVSYRAEPIMVRLDSLANKSRCRIGGEENLVKEKIEGMVVCYNLSLQNTATLGGSTMVEPIK